MTAINNQFQPSETLVCSIPTRSAGSDANRQAIIAMAADGTKVYVTTKISMKDILKLLPTMSSYNEKRK